MCPNVCRLACWSNNYTWRTLPTGNQRDKSLGVEEGEKGSVCFPVFICVCVYVCVPNAEVMIFYCFNSLPMWSLSHWESTMEKFFQFPPNWRPKLLSLFYCSFVAHHIFIQRQQGKWRSVLWVILLGSVPFTGDLCGLTATFQPNDRCRNAAMFTIFCLISDQ